MNRDWLLEIVKGEINRRHTFGEGAGGSGHLASIGLRAVEIVSAGACERDGTSKLPEF